MQEKLPRIRYTKKKGGEMLCQRLQLSQYVIVHIAKNIADKKTHQAERMFLYMILSDKRGPENVAESDENPQQISITEKVIMEKSQSGPVRSLMSE